MNDKRYIVGEAEPWSLPYVGAGFADEVYDLQAADPHTAIAYCDTPDEAAALAERLNAYEAERDALARERDGLRLALVATSRERDMLSRVARAAQAYKHDKKSWDNRLGSWRELETALTALTTEPPATPTERDALARDLDTCRADRSLLAAARAWVEAHGQHPPTCGAARGDGCSCGLDELRG
jgi:Ser/Thr protein kinase RdoA (MazF antagonist)